MANSNSQAHLDIYDSDNLGKKWGVAPIIHEETLIGRLTPNEVGSDHIVFPEEYGWISRKQAKIFRRIVDGNIKFFLQNWQGKNIRMYEKILKKGEEESDGDSHELFHGYQFRIPAEEERYFLFIFCISNLTTAASLKVFEQSRRVEVFGHDVGIKGQEYELLSYLYQNREQVCNFYDIIAYIWTHPRTGDNIQRYLARLHSDNDEFALRKGALDTLVARVRDRIRPFSHGITFIESVWAEGFRLVP